MRYIADNGVQVIASLNVVGSTVTGTGKAYAPNTFNGQTVIFSFADGSRVANLAINGTLNAGIFSGTYTFGSVSENFSFTLNTQKTNTTSSLAKIVGTYASSLKSNADFIGHIEADGDIWGSGPGIAYSGRIDVIDPDTNAYRVYLAYNKNGTIGFAVGTAIFHEAASAAALPYPAALVPANYTGEVSNLTYSTSTSGNQGVFLVQLTGTLRPIFFEAVKLSTQQQSIAIKPGGIGGNLTVQAISNASFSVTAQQNVQFSESSATPTFTGSLATTFNAGSVAIILSPGSITPTGTNLITIGTQAIGINTLPIVQGDSGANINWNSFNIASGSEVNFTAPGVGVAINRVVGGEGAPIIGTLVANGTVTLINPGGITLNGTVAPAGGGISTGGDVNIVTTGGVSSGGGITITAGP